MGRALATALLFCLLLPAMASAEDAANSFPCDGSVVDVATAEIASGDAAPDIYIIAARDVHVAPGSLFKVFRRKNVPGGTGASSAMLYVGRLKIISAQNNIWIGRAIDLAPRDEYPHVRYETVMIGDCLLLESPSAQPSESDRSTGEAKPSPVQPSPEVSAAAPPPSEEAGQAAKESSGPATAASPAEELPPAQQRWVIPPVVLFDFDKSDIRPEWHVRLDKMAEFIAKQKPEKVIVDGHADAIGTEPYNLELSKRRALAVVKYMTEVHGLKADLFEIRPFGETRPAASNESAEGRQKNRRVYISVISEAIPTVDAQPGGEKEWAPAVEPETLKPENVGLPVVP